MGMLCYGSLDYFGSSMMALARISGILINRTRTHFVIRAQTMYIDTTIVSIFVGTPELTLDDVDQNSVKHYEVPFPADEFRFGA
jgi:hypothetical protein